MLVLDKLRVRMLVLDKLFVTIFRLHRMARSSTSVFVDLLLACCLANDATCAIVTIMTTLIFINLIVSRLHAFCLVVPIRSSLHVLVVVAVISYFQHTPAVRSNDICNSASSINQIAC